MTLKILDACCGSRMAWYDMTNLNDLYNNKLKLEDFGMLEREAF